MKKILFISLLTNCAFAGYSQTTTEEKAGNKIDKTPKDTVFIDNLQTKQIYSFNMEEFQVKQKYADSDSLASYKTKMEGKRDALYQKMLATQKYNLYKQKKIAVRGSDNNVIIE